ncbi:DUF6879 family protein [Kitasatospora indigofera]|uniref:DUF6879 family protein n=1 Tax=Kitasatospora indigofera TaxID=67307 RepID=UPI00363B8BE4
MASETTFEQLFRSATESALHLEMRDGYMRAEPGFVAWTQGRIEVDDPESVWWRNLVRTSVARGVHVRRARIVSEPLSDYTQYEYDITEQHNIAAGEVVRWLPRRGATPLLLPANDFWLFDGKTLLVNHFTGNGDWTDTEQVTDPIVVRQCAEAFAHVWSLAEPHSQYRRS